MTDNFTRAYLAAALWSSTDDDGNPLDSGRDISDIPPAEIEKAANDCREFRTRAGDLLNGWTDEQAGHDFWLTRNRHGAGFWDRGGLPNGDALTEIAHAFGELWLYVGDDGLIYGF